jgi:hypothetical protein
LLFLVVAVLIVIPEGDLLLSLPLPFFGAARPHNQQRWNTN